MNKKYIILIILIVLFAVVQTSAFPHMRILDNTPNIVMVLICVFAYFRGPAEGLYTGLAGGLILDILVGSVLGFYGLIYMISGFIMGCFPRQNIKDNLFITLSLTMLLIFPVELIMYWLKKTSIFISTGMESAAIDTLRFILNNVLPGVLYNCIMFIPIYYIIKKFDKYLNKDKKLMDSR